MGLLIDHERAPSLISMPEAIEVLADAYRQLRAGTAVEADRNNLMLPIGWLRTMAAALLDDGLVGYKEFHRFNGRSRFAYHLFDAAEGEQLALLDGRYLTALRTGACGGLAVKLLTPRDSEVLGVIGSGAEARAQVRGILAVRPIRHMYVYSRSAGNRESFCDEMAATHSGVQATPVEDPAAAINPADILVVATNTAGKGPALLGEWLPQRRLHINSVGSTLPNQRELDPEAWGRASCVVLDSDILLDESGDALAARAAGKLEGQEIITLAELVSGRTPASLTGVTLYKSAGSAIQDLAVAARMYRNALRVAEECPTLRDFQSVRTLAT
ncbi:MAG TPA: ornithine cyclodeaminase family protein [Solirubrobacteraceae bacterium]|nr:ornithine cyclodeaminase family protein [Solirubrobacteraceae bacterium]